MAPDDWRNFYQAPENSSKCKVGIELLAHAAWSVHLLARHLDHHDHDDGDGGVGDDLPGHRGEHR